MLYIIYKKDTEGEEVYWSESNEDWIYDKRLATKYTSRNVRSIISIVGGFSKFYSN